MLGVRDLWTIGLTVAVVVAFFVFFRYTAFGLAMRATAFDPEAALAQGISARRVYAVSWAIAAALATLAGITLAAGPGGLSAVDQLHRARRLPGDDPRRARLPGRCGARWHDHRPRRDAHPRLPGPAVLLGRLQRLGHLPYVVMILILLIRPYGLFGTKEVRRI